MEIVYGLFNNMKVVMDGTETLIDIPSQYVKLICFQMERHR